MGLFGCASKPPYPPPLTLPNLGKQAEDVLDRVAPGKRADTCSSACPKGDILRDKEEKKVQEETFQRAEELKVKEEAEEEIGRSVHDMLDETKENEELTEKLGDAAKIAEGAMGEMLGSVGMDFGQMISGVQEFFADFEDRQIKMNNMLVSLRKGQEVMIGNQKVILEALYKVL